MLKLIKLSPNFHKVTFGDTKVLYFSYETPIAFYDGMEDKLIFTQASQIPGAGTTTIKHVNNTRVAHINAKHSYESPSELEQAIINNF